MPELKQFLPSGREIMIEVDGTGSFASGSYSEALTQGIASLAAAFDAAMDGVDTGVEITIAMKALADGGFVIPAEATNPGVTVRLTRSPVSSDSATEGGLVPPVV